MSENLKLLLGYLAFVVGVVCFAQLRDYAIDKAGGRMRYITLPNTARVLAIPLLVLATFPHLPHDYYTVLKWVTFFAFAVTCHMASKREQVYWALLMGGSAVIFNPWQGPELHKEAWGIIDAVAAILLATSFWFAGVEKAPAQESENSEWGSNALTCLILSSLFAGYVFSERIHPSAPDPDAQYEHYDPRF